MRDKRGSFIRLAETRVTKATQMLRLIGNLSNLNNYAYSEEDVQTIMSALEAEMKLLRMKFHTALRKHSVEEFKLK
jgi:molecular chaperone GrpE (heat shock protein)